MDKFLSDVSTVYWWLGVVVVGLLINIVSAYLKDPLDKLGRHVSARWRARSDKVWQAHVLKVEGLKEHPEMHAAERSKEARFRLKAIASFCRTAVLLLMMLLLLAWASYSHQDTAPFRRMDVVMGAFCLVTAIMAVISVLLGSSFYSRANEIEACLFEAGAGG